MTNDQLALREITRMHGFTIMNSILNGFMDDDEIVSLVSLIELDQLFVS